jgi:hypothetical protein
MTVNQLVKGLSNSVRAGRLTGNEWLAVCSVTRENQIIGITPLTEIALDKLGPTGKIDDDGMLVFYPCKQEEITEPNGK